MQGKRVHILCFNIGSHLPSCTKECVIFAVILIGCRHSFSVTGVVMFSFGVMQMLNYWLAILRVLVSCCLLTSSHHAELHSLVNSVREINVRFYGHCTNFVFSVSTLVLNTSLQFSFVRTFVFFQELCTYEQCKCFCLGVKKLRTTSEGGAPTLGVGSRRMGNGLPAGTPPVYCVLMSVLRPFCIHELSSSYYLK